MSLSKKSDIGNKVNSPETDVEEFLSYFTEQHPLYS
jgi:serine/threonine protein kinase